MESKKNKFLAYFLAFFLPGVGHFYLGDAKKGFQFFGVYFVLVFVQIFAGFPAVLNLPLKLGVLTIWVWSLLNLRSRFSRLEDAKSNARPISENQMKSTGLMSAIGFKNKEEFRPVVNDILQKNFVPGEQLIDFGIATKPASVSYLFISYIALFLAAQKYILCLTNTRLILIKLDATNKAESYVAYTLSSLKCLKDSKSLLWKRNLTIQFPDGHKEKFSFVNSRKAIEKWGNVAEQISLSLPK